MSRYDRALMLIVISTLWVACDSTQPSADPVSSPTQEAELVATEEATTPPTEEPTTVPETDVPPTSTEVPAPWPPELIDLWPAEAQAPWPTDEWSHSTPEEQGLDSQILVDFLQFLQSQNINYHSLLVIRNGYLVLEDYQPPWAADQRHAQFSVTKSLTSLLVGLAIEDGYIDGVDQPLLDFYPDVTIENRAEKEPLTIEHMLTMRDGLAGEQFDPESFLGSSLTDAPGMSFHYDNGPPRVLASLADQLLPMRAVDYAQERIFDPLGISGEEAVWGTVGGGAPDGAVGLSLTPQAMARIGYLYLNHGMWDGQPIVSQDWIEQSLTPHVTEIKWHDIYLSYGYFWWINPNGRYFAANGFGGQMVVVLPAQNVIIVITGDDEIRIPLQVAEFSTNLEVAAEPLPANPEALAALQALIED